MDIRLPLKREKKVKLGGGYTGTCKFRYERLPNFCYICGKIGHIDRFCEVLFHIPEEKIVRLWDKSQRAPSKQERVMEGERWLERREVVSNKVGAEQSTPARGRDGKGVMETREGEQEKRLPKGVLALLGNLGACESNKLPYVRPPEMMVEEEQRELAIQEEKNEGEGGKRVIIWRGWSIILASLLNPRRKLELERRVFKRRVALWQPTV
ncbi:hypothetical protein LINPERHAP1_LOCUS26695 [Linum perenne]